MSQVIFLVDDINVSGGSMHAIKKNIETLLVTNNETVLKVNAEKTKYTVMPQDQHAGIINVGT
jgi:hypothetical protein